MAYNPNNPNGQATMANSAPVVIASNQTAVDVNTELPAAAALADATATPTTPLIGAVLMAFNGTTYDRVRTDGTDNDADPVGATGILSVEAHNQGFNGTSWDRLRTIDAMTGTAANNTVVGIQAVGIGPGFSHRYNPTALGTAANSTSTIEVEGGNTMTWAIGSTPATGTIIFEASGDATNFFSVEVFDATQDIWVTGQSIIPVTGRTYHVACGGFRQVRMRTVIALGTALTHTVNVSAAQELIAGIDTGAAPHNFGYTLFHRDRAYTAAETSTVFYPTTATTRRYAITDLTITTGGTTAGIVTLYDAGTGTAFAQNTTPAIFRGEFAPSTTSRPGITKDFYVPYLSAATGNNIMITTSAAMTVYVQVNGYEI